MLLLTDDELEFIKRSVLTDVVDTNVAERVVAKVLVPYRIQDTSVGARLRSWYRQALDLIGGSRHGIEEEDHGPQEGRRQESRQ